MHKYLIHHKKVSKQELLLECRLGKNIIVDKDGYVVFSNSYNLIKIRQQRLQESRRKYAKALWVSQLLSYIPTIKLIGISGSLSMFNSKKEDDIDLFFVTSRNTLWITRMLVLCLLILFKEKRERYHNLSQDKICPNMFLSEHNMSIPHSKRSLYAAHEVSQLKIIHSKDDTDKKFLYVNKWALAYLPHAFRVKKVRQQKKPYMFLFFPFELAAFLLQYVYMRRRITNETVGLSVAMFHPRKSRSIIQDLYNLKVKYRTIKYLEQKIQKKPTSLQLN
ncbi:MAG: hypothetical protein KA035_04130 [Candidatus Levybacteria bacterium]|nr:hypothetical protein [Candidatus Levybacteria bacterium]